MEPLFAYLYSESVFSDIESTYFFDIGCIFISIIRGLCEAITKALTAVLNACEYLLKSCWNVLQLSNFAKNKDTAGAELYRLVNDYLWIPVLISVVLLAGFLIFSSNGKERLKRFTNNIVVIAVITILLPSVFTSLDTNIFGKNSSLLTVSSTNTSSSIVFNHTTDYLYVYNEYVKDNLKGALSDFADKKDIKTITSKSKATGAWTLSNKNKYLKYLGQSNKKGIDMSKIDITNFDFNQTLDEDEAVSDDSDDLKVPAMLTQRMSLYAQQKLSYKIDSNGKQTTTKDQLNGLSGSYTSSLRSGGFFIGDEHYYRYRTDYICVFLELIANIFLYVAASYALVKIAWELMINRIILAFIGATDLNGGERMKRILTSIIGMYVSFMFVGFTIQLFNSACLFISKPTNDGGLGVSGLAYSIIVVFLATIALDGPNIIARYFGVNTGMRGGAMMLAGGLMAAKRASDRARHNMGNAYRDARREYSSRRDREARNDGYTRPPLVNMQPPVSTQNAQPNLAEGVSATSAALPNAQSRDKPKTLDDYKEQVALENPNMSKEEQSRAANQRMAEDKRDDLMKSAILGKAKSEENGTPYTDRQALQGAVEEKSIDGMFDKQYASDVADNMYSNGQFKKANMDAYSTISENAETLIDENKDKYSKPMDAYVAAAQGYGAKGDTAVYMGNVAYADNNRQNIRAEAIQYKNEMRGNNKQITDSQALAYVIRNNSNGCACDINPKYADSIAKSMLNNGNLYNGDIRDSYRRNRGASQL